MTVARVGLAIVGGVAGYFAGGGTGLGVAQGASLGYSLGGYFDPAKKVQGPRLADLKAPAATYGSPWSYVEGAPRLAGVMIYSSDKIPIETTQSEGKGGPRVQSTTDTYEINVLIGLAINPCDRIRRIFSNGKLIWTNASDTTIDSLTASSSTPSWRDIRFYNGNPAQLPDPVYEAAVGIGNAPAYRGRATVFIEGLNLGNSGQLPVLTFEVCSQASLSGLTEHIGALPIYGGGGYYASGLYANADGSATVHVGGGPGAALSVTVQRIQTDGTITTLKTYTTEGASGGPGTGTSAGLGNTDRSAGVWFHGDNFAGSTHVRLYDDSAVLLCDFTLTTGAFSSPARYVLAGDAIVVSSYTSTSNSWTIYHYSVSTGLLVSSSPYSTHGLSANSMAIIGNDLWVKETAGPALHRFDLDTMAFDSTTYAIPSTSQDGNGNRLVASGGRLYYALSAGLANDGVLYGRNADGTWEIVNPSMGLAGPTFGSEGLLGETYYSLHTNTNPAPLYRSSGAIGLSQVPLDQVVSHLCLRTGLLTAADLDVTALVGKYVRALAVSQVGPTRTTLELLMAAYRFDFVEGDKLKAVLRGGAPVMTLPYADLGASQDGNAEPFPKKRLNDIEIASRVTIKYANVLNDFQDGAESGERLITESTAETVVELALGMTPTEAKRVADVQTMDLAVSLLQIGPIALPRKYAALEPTDVVLLVDSDASTFRARIVKATSGGGINTLEFVLDDATIINSAAATDSTYTGSTLVRLLPDTSLELLDIPILRDADNTPGFYAATQARGSWPGAEVDRSSDDVSYSRITTSSRRAVVGTASTALQNFTGGIVVDEYSSLTVNVGDGLLSSITNAVLLDSTANALLVGSEIVQFRSAALVTAGVYLLTGFIRGCRGTEWAMASHVANERVVLLDANTLLRIEEQQADIGLNRYYKAVTFGKSIAQAASKQFTDTGVALKPFAPVDLGFDASGNVVWDRRSRLSSRLLSTVEIPLGEFSESYDVELRDASSVLVSTTTVSTPSFTLPVSHAGYSVTVWQRSAAVGRGYPSKPLSV